MFFHRRMQTIANESLRIEIEGRAVPLCPWLTMGGHTKQLDSLIEALFILFIIS